MPSLNWYHDAQATEDNSSERLYLNQERGWCHSLKVIILKWLVSWCCIGSRTFKMMQIHQDAQSRVNHLSNIETVTRVLELIGSDPISMFLKLCENDQVWWNLSVKVSVSIRKRKNLTLISKGILLKRHETI